jgi:putative oxidoreductase
MILNNKGLETFAITVGRVLLALIFVLAGLSKITDQAGTISYMASVGLPSYLLPLVILTEVGGGLLFLLGYQTRIVAILLAGFTLLTAIFFHHNFADQMQMTNFLKNLAIVGGFLYAFGFGAGQFSLDNWRARTQHAST